MLTFSNIRREVRMLKNVVLLPHVCLLHMICIVIVCLLHIHCIIEQICPKCPNCDMPLAVRTDFIEEIGGSKGPVPMIKDKAITPKTRRQMEKSDAVKGYQKREEYYKCRVPPTTTYRHLRNIGYKHYTRSHTDFPFEEMRKFSLHVYCIFIVHLLCIYCVYIMHLFFLQSRVHHTGFEGKDACESAT